MTNTYDWYLPDFLQPIKDYRALGAGVDAELSDLTELEMQIYNNSFLVSCDEPTLARMEASVGIAYAQAPSVEERRANLFILIGKSTPFTYNRFLTLLGQIMNPATDDFQVNADFSQYTIELKTREAVTSAQLDFVQKFLTSVVPANIHVEYNTLYNTWLNVQKYKWGQAAMFDWRTFGGDYRVGDDSVIPELTNLTPNPRTPSVSSNNAVNWSNDGLVAVPVPHPISGITQARRFTLVALISTKSPVAASIYSTDGLDWHTSPARRWGVWVLATIPGLEAWDWSRTQISIPLPVNVWTWVEWPRVEAAVTPAYIEIRTSDGSTAIVGTETYFTGACAVPADQEWTQGYFDGSYAPPGYVSWWTGGTNTSISKMSPKLI